MIVSTLLTAIKADLSKEAQFLSDPTTEDFKLALARWSDNDVKTPGAIVLVATEDDIINTVCRPKHFELERLLTEAGQTRHQTRRTICSQVWRP